MRAGILIEELRPLLDAMDSAHTDAMSAVCKPLLARVSDRRKALNDFTKALRWSCAKPNDYAVRDEPRPQSHEYQFNEDFTMWTSIFDLFSRLSEKTGSVGAIVSAMGCTACFPAIASLGASIGLGFLGQFEGLFINTLLPIFAVIALVANLLTAWSHRRIGRMLFGIAGPSMVLATLYLFWNDNWSTYMFYVGLAFMLIASIWDIASPPRKACAIPVAQPEMG